MAETHIDKLVDLLLRKQSLVLRSQEEPAPRERDKVERQIKEIDAALNLLDPAKPSLADIEKQRNSTVHSLLLQP